MNRIFYTLLIMLISCISLFPQIYIGASAGVISSNITGDSPEDASYSGKIGFTGGLILDIPITNEIALSFQPRYLQKGTIIQYDMGDEEYIDSVSVSLDYISLPVLVKIYSLNKRIFFSSGLDFGYLLSANAENLMDNSTKDISDLIEKYDLSVAFGLGLNIPVGSPIISVELRYMQSILNLSNNSSDDSETTFPYRFRSTGLQLLASILIPL